ncbi:hypothetical protein SAMN05446635_4557 [Burkholderia sp. OK233]|nr:hypothetical protein SAMN05446635_4557 [Burkholderia sp. OK233]
MRRAIANPAGFDALPETGRAMRPFLPAALGRKIPNRTARAKTGPAPEQSRKPRAAAARWSGSTDIYCATTLAMRQKRSGSASWQLIAMVNIGCQTHLDGAGHTPVRHWIELVEASLP